MAFLANKLIRDRIHAQLAVNSEKSRAIQAKRLDLAAFSAAAGDGIDPAEFASLGEYSYPFVEKYLQKMTTIFPGRFQQVHTNAYSGAFMNSPALQGAFASLQKQYPDCNDQIIQAMAMEQYGMSPEIIAKNAYDTAMKEVLKELEKEINIEDRKLDVEQKKIEDEAKMLEKQAEALDQAIDKGIDKNAPKYC